MRTELFDYHLPRELIAATPAPDRATSRLLVLHRDSGRIEHRIFAEIGNYLRIGDLLVVNDSRVIRARIHGRREVTGGKVELLLIERENASSSSGQKRDVWKVLCRPAKKLMTGERIYFANKRLFAEVIGYEGEGERTIAFETADILLWLDELGEVPLPPYILQRRAEIAQEEHANFSVDADAERYQTVYAREPGSVAAPTAGLHFTSELLASLEARGVRRCAVTLHVGPGTFKPVEVENVEDHPMHEEHFTIGDETAEAVNTAGVEGRRVVCIGTTSVRALESGSDDTGMVRAGHYSTRLLIVPGYKFKLCDVLLTNFHLPRSTLLMLVSAFASRELIVTAYQEAIRERYRFFSFGDAMLIV